MNLIQQRITWVQLQPDEYLPLFILIYIRKSTSRKHPGRNIAFKLSSELVDAAKGRAMPYEKRIETHKMAEANRDFAHFR
ncbi:hypothetical protein AQUCO_02400158v1 [Aquilegia coerulea]|uniref:Small ribosomal subunit protein uS7 domain-containing protein n=1 Tax=Aquilegia coerulea TaxID=218851 RepID=A0A2G5DBM4_AQUCA|nr:hypothetical protein AQUCO_02400158v1 [Aquilegia coerulea]